MRYVFAEYELDTQLYELRHAGQPCPLEPQVFNVLLYLLQHRDRVVTRTELLDQLWPRQFISEVTLNHCVMAARKAIGDSGRAQRCIQTLHGRGYRFIAAVRTVAEARTPAPLLPVLPAASVVRPDGGPPQPFVAREAEVQHLHQCLAAARRGERQVVFITGEAGIGKTTLVDTFVAQVAPPEAVWIGRGQCCEQHGAGEPYLPLLEALGRLGRGPDGQQLVAVLQQQAPSWLLQLPALVPDDAYAAVQRRGGGVTRERMLRELAEAVEALTATRPVVLVLEDLHWSDAATVDWLAYVARRREAARLLVLGTYRPTEALVRGHPIHTAAQDLQLHGQGHELSLGYFPEAAVAAYLAQRVGTAQVPAGLVRALYQRTTGNPLFLTALVDMLERHGRLRDVGTGGAGEVALAATTEGVPNSLRQLMEQQLAQLASAVQGLLEAASVAGQAFAVAAVAAAVAQPVEGVEDQCAALARQGQFLRVCGTDIWPDGTVAERYAFVHDLYREMFYARVPGGRRVRWHRQIGLRLEAGYGAQARERAAELAEHFMRGRDTVRAVQYLHYAGEQAAQRSAHQEALRHCTQGLELLATLPETHERLQQELVFQTMLGPAFMALKGIASPEVAQVYARARELCQQLGDTPLLFPVLWGVWAFHVVHTDLHLAQPLAEQLMALAHRAQDPARLMQAHRAMGQTLFRLGEFAPACTHLEQSLALADPQQHHTATPLYGQDSGVYCLSLSAETLALLGLPDQARQRVHEALRLARERAHPLSLAIVLQQAIRLYGLLRERQAIPELVETVTTLATEHGFPVFIAGGAIMRGWILAEQGQSAAGISQMRQGLADYRQTGTRASVGFYLILLAAAHGKGNQPEEGLTVVAEALELMQQTDNRVYERVYEAELYRLRGELLLTRAAVHQPEATACFQQALAVARRQQAKAWELRAATSLSRLWLQQGKRTAAYDLLAPLYGWFREGFETADLQAAQAVLAALA